MSGAVDACGGGDDTSMGDEQLSPDRAIQTEQCPVAV